MQPIPTSEGLRESRPHFCGTQFLYRFENGYGASVVYDMTGNMHAYDHVGKYELAVIKWDNGTAENESADASFKLTYDTPITNDVEAWLNTADVNRLLAEIAALPAPTHTEETEDASCAIK